MIHQLPILAAQFKACIKRYRLRLLDVTHTFGVLELTNGNVYIETTIIDDEGIEMRELLFSRDKVIFILLQRQREGENHNSMRSYSRDSEMPVGSKVSFGVANYAI